MKTNIYSLMMPEKAAQLYEKVKDTLPDAYRAEGAFFNLLRTSMIFEVGDFQGAFWFTDLIPGWKANVHIVLWDDVYKKQASLAREVLKELMSFLHLYRVEAFIPSTNVPACRYAEKVGMKHEGILRKANMYDGVFVDIAAYSVLQGEL